MEDPWAVIDPLLSEAPDVTAKLTPVCRALGVDKNELAAKRAMATYARLTASAAAVTASSSNAAAIMGVTGTPKTASVVTSAATSFTSVPGGGSNGSAGSGSVGPSDAALATAIESVRAIACPLRRVRVWAWMSTTERNRNDELALRWVLNGLEEINGYKRLLKSRMKGDQHLAAQGMRHITSSHVMSCRFIIININLIPSFSPSLSSPSTSYTS